MGRISFGISLFLAMTAFQSAQASLISFSDRGAFEAADHRMNYLWGSV